ncbi:hypothetical protein V5E97_35375 [Singulisphaera sp. Ch08]|uniref:MFS transporter n=1 Tax=Singulisphaera sp. Ch08 TaxID=3120278 RepID=A0AAU7CEX6_9BACT
MSTGRLEDPATPPTHVSAKPQGPRGGLLWHHVWTAIFAANLVAPMWFASSLWDDGKQLGEIGMAMAIAILWLLGDIAGARSRDMRLMLIAGGIIVAISQFFPLLQMVAGVVSLTLVAWISGSSTTDFGTPQEQLSSLEYFLATLFTGSLLLLASCLAGLPFRWLRDRRRVTR